MALIKCPECNREVSDKAKACPNCGCPISTAHSFNVTSLKIGDILYESNDWAVTLANSKRSVQIFDTHGSILGEGATGTVLRFQLEQPTFIEIKFKPWPHQTLYTGTIFPNRKYELVKLPSLLKGKWTLNEIDVIDSGF